ncbi:hypothetical protein FKW77_005020 [Venturia effusa]|uniref:PhoD-like phosphatase metallophosphatase domain-containing protein n=1 Tax=Venturia effusa TaxID=50376 RepID=A0A517KZF8_9PEZI|nr:hypothetical protein FKW77_005020 [Venturia effusa]
MPFISNLIAGSSSTVLRVFTYIFLRWIPGHHAPPIIYTAFAVYLTSFIQSFQTTSPFEVISDEIDIITRETVAQGDDSEAEDEAEESSNAASEEIDVSERVVLEERGPQILRTLLLGLPSPTSLFLSTVTVLLNFALVAMTLDMVYRAPLLYQAHDLSFTRVGYVSSDSAKLLIREPDSKELPIYVRYRYADSPLKMPSGSGIPDTTWKYAGSITESELSEETDYTSSAFLRDLHPDTRYQYALSNNHSGHFYTAPAIGQVSRRNGGKFTFLHSSCIKPRVPYNPLDHALHFPGFKHLADWIPKLKAHFMIFLGDFIYADVPQRFGVDVEAFRGEYRRVYASPDWPSVSDELPWIHVLDDHEIANDWDQNTTGIYLDAVDPWQNYQVAVNPPPGKIGHTWFVFTQGPASFFMMDTRRYRTSEKDDPNDANSSMLGKEQLTDLIKFLHAPNQQGVKWKIVISSVPFTKNWRFGGKDTWGGYLVERQVILEAMWEVGSRGTGVVVLSGDRHEFAATSFPPPEGGEWPQSATVYEFSTSPLSMFYLPIRTYKQSDQEDVAIKYLPDGSFKFGAVEIYTPELSEQSMLHYRLFVDGEEVWTHTVPAPPAAGHSLFGTGR